jgi:hypothetical protein
MHIGKIGRLSKATRTQLGHRLEDGLPGVEIVHWLNSLPDVQQVLQDQFGGRPITEQNLSDWRQSGHLDWLRHEEAREAAQRLTEHADDLDELAGEVSLADRFAVALAAEMNQLATLLLEQEADPEKRWQRLCQINRELSHLRRDDHRAQRIALSQEQWDRQVAREKEADEKREQQDFKAKATSLALSPIYDQLVASALGGGQPGRHVADLLHRVQFDLPVDDLIQEHVKTPAKTKKSRLIVANPPKNDNATQDAP